MPNLTDDDRKELAEYLVSKLLKRGLADQPEAYLNRLLTGYINDWLDALDGEGRDAPDPDDCGTADRYTADDFADQYFTR